VATWPARWQPEAIAALEPLLGSDSVVEVWVGDPLTSRHGILLAGHVFVDADGRAAVVHDRSGRPDVHPWPLLAGPVLRLTARARGRRRTVLFEHPSWRPDQA
jgi:hypothetical protein